MEFLLWTEVEFAHGCAVAPHQDFVKSFFIVCKVLVGPGFFLFSELSYTHGTFFFIVIFCTKRIKN